MAQSSRIIFFGNERLSSGFDPHGAPTLEALLAHDYDVVAVVANFEAGQGRKTRPLEIAEVAKVHNIPVLLPKSLSDSSEELAKYGADVGVLVAYGKIVPQKIINLFPSGIINIHPSLLPHYRGSTPIEQAMLDGVTTTGVSLMGLVKAMDAGPIFAQEEIPLTGAETKQALTAQLLTKGAEMVITHLPSILSGKALKTPQNEAQATFCGLLSKQNGVLDLAKTAIQLEREIRAYALWPKSRTTFFGHDIIVQAARVAHSKEDGALVVPCKDSFLEITQLIGPSGRSMSGADFIRGYKK